MRNTRPGCLRQFAPDKQLSSNELLAKVEQELKLLTTDKVITEFTYYQFKW